MSKVDEAKEKFVEEAMEARDAIGVGTVLTAGFAAATAYQIYNAWKLRQDWKKASPGQRRQAIVDLKRALKDFPRAVKFGLIKAAEKLGLR